MDQDQGREGWYPSPDFFLEKRRLKELDQGESSNSEEPAVTNDDIGVDMEKYFKDQVSEGEEEESSEEEMEFGEEGEDLDDYKPAETKGNKSIKGALLQHKQELEQLRDSDPEFYKYLQQTDPKLLNFGEGTFILT